MDANFAGLVSSKTRKARAQVADDLRSLAHDANDLLNYTAGDLSENARQARLGLRNVIDRVKDTCGEVQERSMETARAAAKRAGRTVRTHPYQSLGVALGIGVLLGFLIRRR